MKIGQKINIATLATSKNNHTNSGSSLYVIQTVILLPKSVKSGVSVSSIQELNPTVDPTQLKIGQKINISTSVPSNNNHANKDSSVYVIKSGDTFTKIGKTLGVSISSIQELNPTIDPTKLKIGQKINISTRLHLVPIN